MKKSFILIFTVLSSLGLFAQTKTANNIQCDSIISYKNVDTLPEFKTDEYTNAIDYIYSNMHYPIESNIIGSILVSFVITKNGEVKNVKVEKELFEDCDNDVVRLLNSMPNWKPGIKNGKKVNTLMNLEVMFVFGRSTDQK